VIKASSNCIIVRRFCV